MLTIDVSVNAGDQKKKEANNLEACSYRISSSVLLLPAAIPKSLLDWL